MKKILFIIITLAFANAAMTQNTSTTDEGVEINGVIWATRNVDMTGTFAENPEGFGMFYQWNRNVAWNTTEPTVTNWDTSMPEGTIWETANNPCPAGWRVPTYSEFGTLLDASRVNKVWTNQNGIFGGKFTDRLNGNSIFIPAAGRRQDDDGTLISPTSTGVALYWCAARTTFNQNLAHAMSIVLGFGPAIDASLCSTNCKSGLSVRCVKEEDIPTSVNNISSEKEKIVLGYYNILGEKLPKEPESGIFIILYDNGIAKKTVK